MGRRPIEAPRRGDEKQGQGEVVLFLDRERPEVEERRVLSLQREVVLRLGRHEVGHEDELRGCRLAELLELVGCRDAPEESGEDGYADGERREEAPDPCDPEALGGERSGLQLADEPRGDEVSGDDEENIDPHETAAEARNARVEQHHGQHRDCAQAVNFGTVGDGVGGGCDVARRVRHSGSRVSVPLRRGRIRPALRRKRDDGALDVLATCDERPRWWERHSNGKDMA